jgi:hypothetical protein
MSPFRSAASIGALLSAVALAACDSPTGGGQAQADAQTRAACRARAEQVYEQQNRGAIYSPPPAVNTPYSGNFAPGMDDRGLSDLFAHDRLINDCIRNSGTGAERSAPAQPATAPASMDRAPGGRRLAIPPQGTAPLPVPPPPAPPSR